MDELDSVKMRLQVAVLNHAPEPGSFQTCIPGVAFHRRDMPTTPESHFYSPKIIKIIQGRKQSVMGGVKYLYDADNVFIAGVDMPNTSNIIQASPERPALSMTMELDRSLISQLALERQDTVPRDADEGSGILLQPATMDLQEALLRLVRLLEHPHDVSVLAPLIIKEIHYRILTGPGGEKLQQFYTFGSQRSQVTKSITWIRQNYRSRFTVDELADTVHMSPSTFHRRFKEMTTVSPLQFQKRIRLHEAQRLMLAEDYDATSACQAVGYESLTQFNREYKRLFGEPPRRNIHRWRKEQELTPAVIPGV